MGYPYSQDDHDKAAGQGCLVLLIAFLVASIVMLSLIVLGAQDEVRQAEQHDDLVEMVASDTPAPEEEPEPFVFDYARDMQYPDYPTGCEGVAAAVILRMNGIDITNKEFIDAMPKSDGEDFVHAYWGDPTSEHGMCTMAPCIVETCKRFVPIEKVPLDVSGTQIGYLPTPCVIWVTMDYADPMYSSYEQEGYTMLWNTHTIVLLSCDELGADVWDPLQGDRWIPFSMIDELYKANGKQAVYIADRGHMPQAR